MATHHWTTILAAGIDLHSIPVLLWVFLIVFILVVVLVIVVTVRNRRDRAETRLRAEAQGWLFGDKQPGQTAGLVTFRIQYSYTGATRSIPWTYTFSTKTVRHPSHYVSTSQGRKKTTESSTVTSRTDWRTTAGKSSSLVLVMPRLNTPSVLKMFNPTPEAMTANMLTLGLTDSEKQGRPTLGLAAGGIGLFSDPSAQVADFGLKEVADLSDDTFNVYAQDEAAARQVLNEQARAALNSWKTSFGERFGSGAKRHITRHPCVLFNPEGLYIYFKDEDSKIQALETTIDLGTRLAEAQKQPAV